MASPSTRVAVYRRRVRASLERVWENVRDWEHLPWLHHASFRSIERLDSGDWGWRARIGLRPDDAEIELELAIELPQRRYVARTLAGPGERSEIWTRLQPEGDTATRIEVALHVPGAPRARHEETGRQFVALYTRLWDEDEAMMRHRAARLAAPRAGDRAELALGSLPDLRTRLPLLVELAGRRWRIVELDGALLAHAADCPHWLGPLDDAPVQDGCIRCPWHGYRFDLRTGRSADGRGLRLPPARRIRVDPANGTVRLGFPDAAPARVAAGAP